jgi:hypothetical protein
MMYLFQDKNSISKYFYELLPSKSSFAENGGQCGGFQNELWCVEEELRRFSKWHKMKRREWAENEGGSPRQAASLEFRLNALLYSSLPGFTVERCPFGIAGLIGVERWQGVPSQSSGNGEERSTCGDVVICSSLCCSWWFWYWEIRLFALLEDWFYSNLR